MVLRSNIVLYAVLFLREIYTSNIGNSKLISSDIIDDKCKIIFESMEDLDIIFEHINKTKSDSLRQKQS